MGSEEQGNGEWGAGKREGRKRGVDASASLDGREPGGLQVCLHHFTD